MQCGIGCLVKIRLSPSNPIVEPQLSPYLPPRRYSWRRRWPFVAVPVAVACAACEHQSWRFLACESLFVGIDSKEPWLESIDNAESLFVNSKNLESLLVNISNAESLLVNTNDKESLLVTLHRAICHVPSTFRPHAIRGNCGGHSSRWQWPTPLGSINNKESLLASISCAESLIASINRKDSLLVGISNANFACENQG